MSKLPGISQFQLTNHVAVVTGGSKGLGQAMAAGLASAGAKLMLVSRNEAEARAAADAIARDYDVRPSPWPRTSPRKLRLPPWCSVA
jgi:NAD(P)-dependent dehydrogenase (short-subunit alcohol dehydrogenase family)